MIKVIAIFIFIQSLVLSDVKSTNGIIKFDIQSDNQAEMILNESGLGISTTPTSNLHINGNAIVSEEIYIGGTSGSSNLNIHGTLGYNFESISTSSTASNNSIILADTVSENIILSLPDASSVNGRSYIIKKTSLLNNLHIRDGGFIDNYSDISLSVNNLGSLAVISHSGNWNILNISGNGTLIGTDNLIGWWKLDESTGTTATDSSLVSNNGTLTNTTFSNNSIVSNLNNGLLFDGVDDSVSIPYTSDYEMDTITVSIWAYPTGTGQQDQMFSKDLSVSDRSWQLRKQTDERVLFIIFADDDSTNVNTASTNTMNLNAWNHVAGTWDGTEIRVYLNGELETINAYSGNLNKSELNNIFIGRSENGDPGYFEGRLDDARVYNKALSQAEITTLASQRP